MKKIGFIDYFLDEWHANNYPAWIKEQAASLGLEWEVAYAWADMDKPDGMTTTEWCEHNNIEQLDTIEELVALSDAIIILSPDHPEHHERLAELALQSGKPIYMDKTFAPDTATAKRLFQLAATTGTPLFSSSALRFADEMQAAAKQYNPESIGYLAVSGPGEYSNYAVHQFEMIVTLMGTQVERVKSVSNDYGRQLIIQFSGERQASYLQLAAAPFQAVIGLKEEDVGEFIAECSNMFERLIAAILQFFDTKTVPVAPQETLAIITLIDAGKQALQQPDEWIEV